MPEAGTLALVAVAAFAAFFVRGLAGFGSAMVGIGTLTLVLPPALVVPTFLMLELVTTLNLLPAVWRQVAWRSLRWVMLGAALTTPLGLVLLSRLDPDPMRLVVSGALLVIALTMLLGVAQRLAPQQTPGPPGALGAGLLSGLLSGSAGIGGPPVIIFYFATTATAISRATLTAYLVFTDIYALSWAGATGVFTAAGWPLAVAGLPFALVGAWAGTRLFHALDDARLKRVIWGLLAVLGASGLAGPLWRLLR
ncbi:MAG: sulfite exporter TauE/SafE family protein [Aquabacterium sp.]